MPAAACLAFFLTQRLPPPPCRTPTTPTPTSRNRSTIVTTRMMAALDRYTSPELPLVAAE